MNEYVPAGIIVTPIYYRQRLQQPPEFYLARVWVIGMVLILLVLFGIYFSLFVCVWSRFRVYSMISLAERRQRAKSHTPATLSSSEESPHSSSLSSASELSLTPTRARTTPYSPASQESASDSVGSGSTDSKNLSTSPREQTEIEEQMMEEYDFHYGPPTAPNRWAVYAPQTNELTASPHSVNYDNNFIAQGENDLVTTSSAPVNPLTTNAMRYAPSGNEEYPLVHTTVHTNTLNVLQPRHIFAPSYTSPQTLNHQRESSFIELDSPVDEDVTFV